MAPSSRHPHLHPHQHLHLHPHLPPHLHPHLHQVGLAVREDNDPLENAMDCWLICHRKAAQ